MHARTSPRNIMVLIKCNPEYDPQFQLNTFVHVHYQSYIATAITQVVI